MLKFSKKVEYGLMAMLHMDTVKNGNLAAAREMSELYHIPPELLGKVMQALVRAGLVRSEQGARGGYRLGRPLEEVTLGQVVEALDGPVHIAPCQDNPGSCGQFPSCNIREPVARVQKQLLDYICGVSLAAFRRNIRRQDKTPMTIQATAG